MRAGALDLASPEVKIHLDSSESSDPVDVEQKPLYETNSLVEEFMLLANISVVKRIQETFPLTAVLRFVTLFASRFTILSHSEDDMCRLRHQTLRSSKICY